MSHREWFPHPSSCVQLVSSEPLGNLLVWLRKKWAEHGQVSQLVSLHELDRAELDVLLNMVTVGEPPLYIFMIEQETRKLSPKIVQYLTECDGHRRVLITPLQHKIITGTHTVVEIPEVIDRELWGQVHALAYGDDTTTALSKIDVIMRHFHQRKQKITLSHMVFLTPYLTVLGRGAGQFVRSWIPRCAFGTLSLFTLSQHLFARDTHNFYPLWFQARERYEDEFWLVYWSDQMWKAYNFVVAMRNQQTETAGVFAKGLPFSFTRGGWRSYKPEVLAHAITTMYAYDCSAKQGGLYVPFEILFHRIMVG